jgi:hypothetical protein
VASLCEVARLNPSLEWLYIITVIEHNRPVAWQVRDRPFPVGIAGRQLSFVDRGTIRRSVHLSGIGLLRPPPGDLPTMAIDLEGNEYTLASATAMAERMSVMAKEHGAPCAWVVVQTRRGIEIELFSLAVRIKSHKILAVIPIPT